MRATPPDPVPRIGLLGSAYGQITDVVGSMRDDDFERPTRTARWSVRALLFHVLLDAQRALIAFASPVTDPPDVDAITYWRPFRPDNGDGGAAHAEFVMISASAYSSPGALVEQWTATSQAAVRAAATTPGAGRISTQGHVLTITDFVDTLITEAVIHRLDLTLDVEAAPPGAEGLALVRTVLDGLLGEPLPPTWSDEKAALTGTGRARLTDADRRDLGDNATRLPLLG